MRGIEPTAMAVRSEASMVEGRMFQFGTNEIVVGRGASAQFAGLTLGNEFKSGQNSWKVVGVFETDGGVSETEIWCDSRVLQGAYRRGNSYQTVLAQLDSADSFTTFRDWLTANPQVNVQVRREVEYYAQQSRALGFNATSVVVSVLAESLALAAIGGAIGGVGAYLAFNGYQTSTMNFSTFSQVAFAFQVTPQLLVMGLIYALAMGLVGGLFPAVRAARLPIPAALREL